MDSKRNLKTLFSQKNLVRMGIAILIFGLGFLTGFHTGESHHIIVQPELGTNEALDSVAEQLPEGSRIIAKFTDDRHALYYLNSGHLMKFDAKSKMLDEVNLNDLNTNVKIYYDDHVDTTGIISAKLSPDQQYLILTAVTMAPDDETEGNYSLASFKLDTRTMNILPYTPPVPKTKEKKDSLPPVRHKEKPKEEEVVTPKETYPEAGDIVQPEQQEPPKE